ncbi:MAG: hypothetical protein U9P72_08245 [Campylobacterota bacterium]|nr:hypothetical protein [Campylobacterota bacterium]
MRILIIYTLLVSALTANPLQSVDTSFSLGVQVQLLKKLDSVHSSTKHTKNTYTLTKGWSQLTAPKDGVDVIKTFQNIPEVKFIVTYDSKSKYWAGFTLDQTILKDIKEMLLLKYLESGVTFFVLSKRDMMIKIESSSVDKTCKKFMNDKKYNTLLDSGLSNSEKLSDNKDISINSRYSSHEYRGYYDDTRTLLIYPKSVKKAKLTQKYGPAEPMVMLNYSSEYENKKFYVYDFLERRCYEGKFPSKRMPPLPVLRVISK